MALEYGPGHCLWTCCLVPWPQDYPIYSLMQFLGTIAVPHEALWSLWVTGLEGANGKMPEEIKQAHRTLELWGMDSGTYISKEFVSSLEAQAQTCCRGRHGASP